MNNDSTKLQRSSKLFSIYNLGLNVCFNMDSTSFRHHEYTNSLVLFKDKPNHIVKYTRTKCPWVLISTVTISDQTFSIKIVIISRNKCPVFPCWFFISYEIIQIEQEFKFMSRLHRKESRTYKEWFCFFVRWTSFVLRTKPKFHTISPQLLSIKNRPKQHPYRKMTKKIIWGK